LFIFLLFYNRNKGIETRVVVFYIIYSFINDNIVIRLYHAKETELIYLFNSIFTLFEYLFFSFFLYLVINNGQFKKFILVCSSLFITFSIIFYFKSSSSGFDSLPASIEVILIIIYCIFLLYEQLDKPSALYVYLSPIFWFTIAFFVYLAGTFFLFLQAADLPTDLKHNFWRINLVCNILKNIFFAIAFYLPNDSNNQLDELRTNQQRTNNSFKKLPK